ncbi:MAG: sensor N-terminal transmembrane domain-containing protein [Rhodospirillales bacterium]|nr:sensor N-terminal transmembrane domain-containing protein [Rhodospirillales bacterium]
MGWDTNTEMTTRFNPPAAARKKRLSSLTLVILAVSILPLVLMGFGVFYLSKYKQNLIEAAYEHMQREAFLINLFVEEDPDNVGYLKDHWNNGQSVVLINTDGYLFEQWGDYKKMAAANPVSEEEDGEKFMGVTEALATFFLYLNPTQMSLPSFPNVQDGVWADRFPEVSAALRGEPDLGAWALEGDFILTISIPVRDARGRIQYALLLMMSGEEVTQAIDSVRKDIAQAFIIVMILTFLLSVYLSSFIAVPLKKLGRAAEDIRRGQRNLTDLPDMSHRKDEIGELSIILRQMTQALNDRIDAIGNFAADVAHEIKNPLTSIHSAIETALLIKDDDKRRALLEIMDQDVKRLDWLITDISKISRLDSELARDSFHKIDLRSVLRETANLWSDPMSRSSGDPSALQKRPQVMCTFPDDPCLTWGSGDALAQVFQNLIANALSFSPPGQPVRVMLTRKKQSLYVFVEDKGPGIPESRLEKVFERFYTDRPKGHDRVKNSGLGLSIAKQIIEAHNGEIFAENIYEEDKISGARFIVILPAYEG